MSQRPDFDAKDDHDLLVIVATAFWDLKDILEDNGQPGRCSVHDARLQKLEYFKAWATGALAALSVVLTVALSFAGVVMASSSPR